jgi:HK97 family phage prohead protease
MKRTVIDIGEFRAAISGANACNDTPAVRFATVGEPVAATEDRTFTFVFSDESVDRYGDVIFARGWDLANFNANPIALFAHDAGTVENVIGRAKNVRVEGSRLIGDIEFMSAEVNPNAEIVFQMVKGGFLNTVSVGFQPIEWELAKDKSRPQGVNFKKQELLEISIVPIPANANALVQAKAAGIDIARLGLKAEQPSDSFYDMIELVKTFGTGQSHCRTFRFAGEELLVFSRKSIPAAVLATLDGLSATRAAPKIHKKGLYSVGFLASILGDLGYLQDTVAWEAEYEGDNSPIPQALLDAMKQLGQVLIDMTAEEVAELLAGRDDGEAEEGEVVALAADDIRLAAIKAIVALPEAAASGLLKAASSHAKGDKVTISIAKGAPFVVPRAGKTISAANEKCLRAAHASITEAAAAILGVVEPDGDEPDDDGEEKAAADLRARRARALARKHHSAA